MYILYKKFKNTEPSDTNEKIIKADILNISADDQAYTKYVQKIQEQNAKINSTFEYVIKEVPDESLTAFLARDREYDLEKFQNTAEELSRQIDRVLELATKLDVFYREARDSLEKKPEDPKE